MKIETKLSARLCQFKHCNGGREWVETIRCAGCAAGGQRTRWWGAPPVPAPPHRRSGPLPPLRPVPRVRRWRRTAPRCKGACGCGWRPVCGEGTQAGRRPLPRNGGAAMRGKVLGGGGGSGARGRRVPPFGPGDAELGERVAGVPLFATLPVWTPDNIVRLNHGTVHTWRTVI